MSKIKLYKDSPLNALGQGVRDLLNYQMIKDSAGQFDPVGESLFSLGEMFASKSWTGSEDKGPSDGAVEEALNQFTDSLPDVDDGIVEDVEVDMSHEGMGEDLDNIAKITPVAKPVVTPVKEISANMEEAVDEEGEIVLVPKQTYVDNGVNSNVKQDYSFSANQNVDLNKAAETKILTNRSNNSKEEVNSLKKLFDKGKFTKANKAIYDNYKATGNIVTDAVLLKGTTNKRLKDGSPLERMNPEKLKALKGLMYNTSNGDSPLRRISHMMNSPFLKTDEGPDLEKVDFRYMKRATSTGIGSLGGAASAGYNLAIDAKNYETAVQQDYDEELSEGMGELVMDLDKTNPNYESDMFELASAKKKEYADGFAAYSRGDIDRLTWENTKMKMKGDLENHGKSLNIIAATDKSFAEGKGSAFNTKASDERLTDYYNTRMKNPDAFTVKSIDGVDTYVGKTLQGEEVRLPISMIANGAAKMQLVPQYDVNKAVNQGLKVMKAFTVEGKTALGTGNRNLSQDNPEEAAQLREMAVDAIKREIGGDETRLRSILADERKLGFNEVEQLLNAEGGSRNENLQGLLQQMSEEIYDDKILNQGGYQAESKTRFQAQQPKQIRGSERERSSAVITSKLNNLGPISPDNISQYTSLLPSDMSIETEKDGRMFIAKGNKQLEYINADNAKALIAKATGVKGYGLGSNESNQTDLSQYNFDI